MPKSPAVVPVASVTAASSSSKSKLKAKAKAAVSSSSDSDDTSSSSDSDDEAPPPSKKNSKQPSAAAATASNNHSTIDQDQIRLFNPTSPRHDRMVLHYVSTPAEATTAVAALSKESIISVDCEGVALSRTGQLCLIQVSTALHPETGLFHVYLFDIITLGEATFTTGLGALLSTPTPTKLFYDVRRDSESLYHQFGIMLAGVCDIQLLEIARRRLRNENINYLPGLARLLGDRCSDLDVDLQRIKDGMSGKYIEEPELWKKRPLTREQNIYAAIDVVLLHILLEEITSPQTQTQMQAKRVGKGKKASEDAEMKDASEVAADAAVAAAAAEEATMARAMEKITGGSAATAATSSATDASLPSHVIRKSNIFVNKQTRALIEQYSDVVWAASIRDVDVEPDMWNRRHVPLVFHHATFPLSLQAACTELLNQKAAAAAPTAMKEKAAEARLARKKRKAAEEAVKIAPTFSVAVAPAAAAAAAATPTKSLSHFVQRVSKTPVARNNYSGVAGTLKHLRSQNEKAAAKPAAATAAATAAAAAAAVPVGTLTTARVNTHFADPTAFHPQVTKELLAQHKKQSGKQTLQAFKKQKIAASDSF